MNAVTDLLHTATEAIAEFLFWACMAALAVVGMVLTSKLCTWAERDRRQLQDWDCL